jgi:signal transduction histidine kinase
LIIATYTKSKKGSSEDKAGTVWVYTECGVIAFAKTELTDWSNQPDRKVRISTFYDDVPTSPINGYYTPYVSQTSTGVFYFGTAGGGLAVIDPRNFSESENKLPPPVYVQQITADGKDYVISSNLELPPLVRDLRIDFTALSFVNPRKVQFRYQLEGQDSTWQDVGVRRQAFYSNLPPGEYRFRVIASNNDGVWNEDGATFGFVIAPAFYQTYWFLLLCVAAAGCLIWLGYRWRVHQVRARLALQFEERLQERTRIAQDLHDTLLQGFLSASMQLHVADDKLSAGSPAKPLVGRVLELMGTVIEEGRNAVRGLRSDDHGSLKLEEALSRVRQELSVQDHIAFHVVVEGSSRPLHPIIRDEVYRIGHEAMINAFRHSHAKTIEVEVEYSADHLRLLVSDDGEGIDSQVLRSGREGHWGLSGMRERAERIGARLNVRSRAAAGTEVELSIPGHVAFKTKSSRHRPGWFSRLRRRKAQE